MKKYFLILLSLISFTARAQKPPIDSTAIKHWPSLAEPAISNNGKYFEYVINNQPYLNKTLILKSINATWESDLTGFSPVFFSDNDKEFFAIKDDSLTKIYLGTTRKVLIAKILSFKYPSGGTHNWLAYQPDAHNKPLVVYNLLTGVKKQYFSVADYYFDAQGHTLVLKLGTGHTRSLLWIDLASGREQRIWQQTSAGDSIDLSGFCFDAEGQQLVYLAKGVQSDGSNCAVWYYKAGKKEAEIFATDQSAGINKKWSIAEGRLSFSHNNKWVFFSVSRPPLKNPNAGGVKVDIWNYKDRELQSTQLNEQADGYTRSYLASKGVNSSKIILIENEDIKIETDADIIPGDHLVISCDAADDQHIRYYVLALKDGRRELIKDGLTQLFSISPCDDRIVYFDKKKKSYYSYAINTAQNIEISKGITTRLDQDFFVPAHGLPVGVAKWINDNQVLVYDNFDIWKINVYGVGAPVNITSGYGQSKHLKFTVLNDDDHETGAAKSNRFILTAYNTLTKTNGFFEASQAAKIPIKLKMDSAIFYQVPNTNNGPLGMEPIKALGSNSWVVMRQTAKETPNYFLTRDFKNYSRLTHLSPQSNYNWLTSELISWKQSNGESMQGILYKPENFNPKEKYPMIVNYYEESSQGLFEFPEPDFIHSSLNIALLVSRGYLVFTPDIHFSISCDSNQINGQAAGNAVISGVSYLSKYPWIDTSKIGINGHSFGGQMTNYLVTHTHLFAAAISSAGQSDFISAYLTLAGPLCRPDGERMIITENDQGRMGTTLWERPDLYLRASSVLQADKVTTPLLLMHNKNDAGVPWNQSVELFMALRRLNKKVWMLQYDSSGHAVYGRDAEDYTIRFMQFFDHFLKGVPPPVWMTEGIPAKLKGVETGYDLDTSGKQR